MKNMLPLLLICLLITNQTLLANSVKFDNVKAENDPVNASSVPEFVKLSDGRIVPLGPGVICNITCDSDIADDSEPHSHNKAILYTIGITGIASSMLIVFKGHHNDSGLSVIPKTTPPPDPNAQTPEPATWLLVLPPMLFFAARRRKI